MPLELVGLVEVVREHWEIIILSLGILGGLLWSWSETRIAHPIFDQIWSRYSPIPLPQSPFNRSSTSEDSPVSKSRGGHLNASSKGYEAQNLTPHVTLPNNSGQDLTPHLRKPDDTEVCDKCGSTNIKTNRTPIRTRVKSDGPRAIHIHRCRNCENQWQEEV